MVAKQLVEGGDGKAPAGSQALLILSISPGWGPLISGGAPPHGLTITPFRKARPALPAWGFHRLLQLIGGIQTLVSAVYDLG